MKKIRVRKLALCMEEHDDIVEIMDNEIYKNKR